LKILEIYPSNPFLRWNCLKLKDIVKIEEEEVSNRRGAFTLNGEEVQGNIILKRVNTNTQELVAKLKERIEEVKNTA
jgi:cobalt-zinc-cadmium resistance protein CzcA